MFLEWWRRMLDLGREFEKFGFPMFTDGMRSKSCSY